MIEPVSEISLGTFAPYDAVIDVRTPAEFSEDHIPGAVNLPVLSNEERAEVGRIYTRGSRFLARRIGAAYIARNVAAHLETALADKDPKFRPVIYCWRGGMRSNAMATILSQIGWRVGVLHGGYKTWRRAVVAALFDETAPLNLVLIDGQTGTAKTEILGRLNALGVQTINLEALAAHKGSVFGADPVRPQPTHKYFESLLFDELSRFDTSAPIAVEAESNRIGRLGIPKRFWLSMRAAPRIEIRAERSARAAYAVQTYAEFIAAPGAVAAAIERLKPFHPKDTIADWSSLAAEARYVALAERLIAEHYDPLYERSRKRCGREPLAVVGVDRLDTDGIDKAVAEAAAVIRTLRPAEPASPVNSSTRSPL